MTKRKKIVLILLSPLILVVILSLFTFLHLFLHYRHFFITPPEIVAREEVVPLPRTQEEDQWAITLHRQMREKFGIEGEEELPTLELCDRQGRGDELIIRSDSLRLRVDRITREATSFLDRTMPFPPWKYGIDQERDATRTQEEIISLAEYYIKKITGRPRPRDYNVLYIRYNRQGGEWIIAFSRTVNGIRFSPIFAGDDFSLSIDDLSGRVPSFTRRPRLPVPPLDVRIPRERATRIARGGLALLFGSAEVVYAELQIVEPTHRFEPRLAWVVVLAGPPRPPLTQRVMFRLVDAQSGRIIGKDMGGISHLEGLKNVIYLD
jgi:hypothetical protein